MTTVLPSYTTSGDTTTHTGGTNRVQLKSKRVPVNVP